MAVATIVGQNLGAKLPQRAERAGWQVAAVGAGYTSVMAVVLFTTMGEPTWWLDASWKLKLPAILGLVLLGTAVYGGCLAAFGFRPRDFSRKGAA